MSFLPIHIIAGLIGLISGFIAVFVVKGMNVHRKSGIVFVYSMVVLGVTGVLLGNPFGGTLVCYFAVTALLTVRRGNLWTIDAVAMAVAIAIGAVTVKSGFTAMRTPSGTLDGVPFGMLFFLGTVALLAAAGDLRIMVRGPLEGSHRIARHLWRMCFALFFASGSFFLGQSHLFPKPVRILPLLAIPAVLPLLLLVYWMTRVLFTKWYRRRADSFRKPAMG